MLRKTSVLSQQSSSSCSCPSHTIVAATINFSRTNDQVVNDKSGMTWRGCTDAPFFLFSYSLRTTLRRAGSQTLSPSGRGTKASARAAATLKPPRFRGGKQCCARETADDHDRQANATDHVAAAATQRAKRHWHCARTVLPRHVDLAQCGRVPSASQRLFLGGLLQLGCLT